LTGGGAELKRLSLTNLRPKLLNYLPLRRRALGEAFRRRPPICVVFGSEADGISQEIVYFAGVIVSIPMLGTGGLTKWLSERISPVVGSTKAQAISIGRPPMHEASQS